jgi:outer membrane protein OmpU
MKKILLATSVLAATTGFAFAEAPTVSGSARMGLVYDDASGDTLFSSRVRVKFEMVGTTDGGLEFGASVRADQDGGSGNDAGGTESNTNNGDSTVYVKSGAFKLTMGDVGGAADALVGQVSGVGFGPHDDLQEISFIGTTKTAVYAEYTAGALTFGLGAGQTNGSGEYNVAVKYATDAYSVAIGYEDSGAGQTRTSLSGSATFGSATVKAKVVDDNVLDTAFALSLDYALGATTLTGFYTDFGSVTDTVHIGLGAAYDLGGGASIKGGIVQQDASGVKTTFADVGIVMSF